MIKGPSLMRWVVGYENLYLVHRDGYVLNGLAHTMKTHIDRYGYANVRLVRGGKQSWKKLHRVVCEAWHGPPPGPDCHAAHLDGNPLNNRAENVAWKTPKENEADKLAHGTWQAGERHPRARLTVEQVAAIRADARPSRTVARDYGVSQSHVVRIRNGQMWAESIARKASPETPHGIR